MLLPSGMYHDERKWCGCPCGIKQECNVTFGKFALERHFVKMIATDAI